MGSRTESKKGSVLSMSTLLIVALRSSMSKAVPMLLKIPSMSLISTKPLLVLSTDAKALRRAGEKEKLSKGESNNMIE